MLPVCPQPKQKIKTQKNALVAEQIRCCLLFSFVKKAAAEAINKREVKHFASCWVN
jgi:hypothetical protein